MCGGSPSAPPPPPRVPEAPRAPEIETTDTALADRRRRARAAGDTGTILTSARGVQDGAVTVTKTLLGQ